MKSSLFFAAMLPVALSLVCNDVCPSAQVSSSQIADGKCDSLCNTALCGLDTAPNGYSDCRSQCSGSGCTISLLGNSVCDSQCNSAICGFDGGDCGFCAQGCTKAMLENNICETACNAASCGMDNGYCIQCADGCFTKNMVGNGKCEQVCNNVSCGFDSKECGICSEGCQLSSLGNSICDAKCMTELCEFDKGDCASHMIGACFDGWIGDGLCNRQCYVEAARWDVNDCDCAPGCTHALYSNSICDSACANAACAWDNHVCVTSSQGVCAKDCFQSKLGDGVCDQACSSSACNYDNGDCICSLGCLPSSKGQCLVECMKPACRYDDFGAEGGCKDDFKLQLEIAAQSIYSKFSAQFDWAACITSSPSCTEAKLKQSWVDRTCSLDCNTAECVYDLGLCTSSLHEWCDRGFGASTSKCFQCKPKYYQFLSTCTEQLPRGFERNAANPTLITQLQDRSSEQLPDIIYALQTSTPGIGSLESPYNSLIVSLAAAWQKYTIINLIGESLTTTFPLSSPELLKLQNTDEPLTGKAFQKLIIRSLTCSSPQSHPKCVNAPTKIDVSDKIILRISGYVEFINVEFTSTSLFAGTQYKYCPYVQFLNGMWQDDRGVRAYYDKLSAARVCDPFSSYSLFIVVTNGTLMFEVNAMQSVNVTNFNIQPLAFINIQGGDVLLTNVHFDSIMSRAGSATSGFILQKENCGQDFCGTFQFYNGSVSYLNNGFEYIDGLKLNPFLYGAFLWQLNFTNVTFQYNTAIEGYFMKQISTSGIIYLENFVFLWMENCLFYGNLVTGGLLVVRSNVLVPKHINEKNETIMYLYDHVVWRKLNFTANYAENGLLQTTWNKELLNVDMRDCYFAHNALQSQYFVYIANIWKLVVAVNGAFRNFYVPELGEVRTVWVFLRYINITRVIFEDNSSFQNLLYIQGYANINITHIIARRNGNFRSDAATLVMSKYISESASYGTLFPTFVNRECNALIFLYLDIHFSLAQNHFEGNACSLGGTGIKFLLCSGRAAVSDLFAVDNYGAYDEGLIVEFSGPISITFSRFTLLRNKNDLGTLIRFTTYSEVNFTDSVFTGNSGQRGVCLQAAEGLLLRFTNSILSGNKAPGNLGGAIQFTIKDLPRQSLFVSGCKFEGNSASEGGVFYIITKALASLELLLLSNLFASNKGEISSSVLRLREDITLTDTSRIEDCTFSSNESPRGAIYSSHSGGRLAITKSQFSENSGVVCACVALETPQQALTVLTSLTFSGNKAGPVVMKLNSKVQSRFQTLSCIFTGNEKGAVMLEGGTWEDSHGVFSQSGQSPAALYSGALGVVADSTFKNNHGTTGGAVYLGSVSIFLCTRCMFDGNSATEGGAIYSEQGSAINVTWSEFKNNGASRSGSAVLLLSSPNVVSAIINSKVHDNVAGTSAAINILYASLTLNSVDVYSNEAGSCPAVMLMLSHIEVLNCTLRDHSSSNSGLMQVLDTSVAVISQSQLRNAYGKLVGAIYVTNSELTLIDSVVQNIVTETSAAFYASSLSRVSFERVKMFHIRSSSPQSLLFAVDSYVNISHCAFSDYAYGGLNGNKLFSFTIQSSTFTDGRGMLGAAVYCAQCVETLIEDSEFVRQNGTYGGALSLETLEGVQYVGKVTLRRNLFEANTAIWGAAAYLNQVNITVSECEFIGNRVFTNTTSQPTYGDGAAIYLDCGVVTMCQALLSENRFERNIAERAGGAIIWKLVKPIVENNTMLNNSAVYAPDIASFPIKIQLETVKSRSLVETIDTTAPGQPSGLVLVASLVDHYGQVAVLDSSSTAELVPSDPHKITVSGLSKVGAVNGIFTFDDFMIYADPNSTATVYLSSPTITNGNQGDPDPHVPTISLDFPMRECVMGEINAPRSCLVCGKGTYSFDPTGPCQNCPTNAVCLGNITIVPDPGYWRDDIYSPKIWECPYKPACLGGWPEESMPVNLTGYCATGYRSNMCQSCEIGFSRSGKNQCGKCPDRNSNIVKIVFICLAAVIVVAILLMSSLKSATKPKALHSIYFKILANYLQIVMLVAGFKLEWPKQVKDLFSTQEQAGGVTEQAYSFDCLLANNQSASDIYFVKIVFMAILPIILLIILILVWSVIALKRKKIELLRRELPASIVIVFFLIQPNLIQTLFGMFSCTEIKTGEYWLTLDMAIKCWNSNHFFYALSTGLPGVLLWVFAVPLVCLAILTKYRARHDELWIRLQYGFLIAGYRRRCFYWEFVIMFRKVMIIICAVFLNNSVTVQALTVQFVILMFLVLHYQTQPYVTGSLNSMEMKAILVADVTIYCGLYYITQDLSEGSSWFFFIIIVLVNAVFLLYWLHVLLNHLKDQLARAVPVLGHRFRPHVFEFDLELEEMIVLCRALDSDKIAETANWTPSEIYRKMLQRNRASDAKILDASSRHHNSYIPVMPPEVNSESFSSERLPIDSTP